MGIKPDWLRNDALEAAAMSSDSRVAIPATRGVIGNHDNTVYHTLVGRSSGRLTSIYTILKEGIDVVARKIALEEVAQTVHMGYRANMLSCALEELGPRIMPPAPGYTPLLRSKPGDSLIGIKIVEAILQNAEEFANIQNGDIHFTHYGRRALRDAAKFGLPNQRPRAMAAISEIMDQDSRIGCYEDLALNCWFLGTALEAIDRIGEELDCNAKIDALTGLVTRGPPFFYYGTAMSPDFSEVRDRATALVFQLTDDEARFFAARRLVKDGKDSVTHQIGLTMAQSLPESDKRQILSDYQWIHDKTRY